jgi:hypothetical protein
MPWFTSEKKLNSHREILLNYNLQTVKYEPELLIKRFNQTYREGKVLNE